MSDLPITSYDTLSNDSEENFDTANICFDSIVLVKFATKKNMKYFIGQVDHKHYI